MVGSPRVGWWVRCDSLLMLSRRAPYRRVHFITRFVNSFPPFYPSTFAIASFIFKQCRTTRHLLPHRALRRVVIATLLRRVPTQGGIHGHRQRFAAGHRGRSHHTLYGDEVFSSRRLARADDSPRTSSDTGQGRTPTRHRRHALMPSHNSGSGVGAARRGIIMANTHRLLGLLRVASETLREKQRRDDKKKQEKKQRKQRKVLLKRWLNNQSRSSA